MNNLETRMICLRICIEIAADLKDFNKMPFPSSAPRLVMESLKDLQRRENTNGVIFKAF